MSNEDGMDEPVKVRLSESFARNKLSIPDPSWQDRHLIIYKHHGQTGERRSYTVDRADNVVQHFIDGGELEIIEEAGNGESFEERLESLPNVGPGRAETIMSEYGTWTEFKDEVSVEWLTENFDRVGVSTAEQILEEIN